MKNLNFKNFTNDKICNNNFIVCAANSERSKKFAINLYNKSAILLPTIKQFIFYTGPKIFLSFTSIINNFVINCFFQYIKLSLSKKIKYNPTNYFNYIFVLWSKFI